MNPFLIEPYQAYQNPPKKKHWMEIAEEEALFHRMMTEANKVQPSSQQTVATSPADSGAGGTPPYSYFHPTNTSTTNLIQWEPSNIDAISMLGLFAYDNNESLIGVTDLSILCETNREGIDIESANDLVNLSFPNLTEMTEGAYFNISNCSNLNIVSCPLMVSSSGNIELHNVLSSLQTVLFPKLEYVYNNSYFVINGAPITTLSIPKLKLVGSRFSIYDTLTTSCNLSKLESVGSSFDFNFNSEATSLDISSLRTVSSSFSVYACPKLTTIALPPILNTGQSVSFFSCSLNQTTVNNVLISLSSGSISNGAVDLSDGLSATPSGAGLVAKGILEGRGWTVTTN